MTDSSLPTVFAALGDASRWAILEALGEGAATASELATRLPISRQAIAKHLTVLRDVGVVISHRHGRDVRFEVIASRLSDTARRLDAVGTAWDQRLAAIRALAEAETPQNRSEAGSGESIQTPLSAREMM